MSSDHGIALTMLDIDSPGPAAVVALVEKALLLKKFPSLRAYEVYEQPFFKLRVGDYSNRFDAFKALNDLKSTFPVSFIVSDKVNISEL